MWPITYEGIHLVCFNCGLYGHKHDQCNKGDFNDANNPEGGTRGQNIDGGPVVVPQMVANAQVQKHQFKDNYEPWMLAPHRDRRGQGRGGNRPLGGRQPAANFRTPPGRTYMGVGTPSRFAVLDGLDRP